MHAIRDKTEYILQVLTERRNRAKETNTDPVVWTNEQVINWVKSIDLEVRNNAIYCYILAVSISKDKPHLPVFADFY